MRCISFVAQTGQNPEPFLCLHQLETAPDHFIMLKLNKLEKQTIRPAAEVYDVCAQLCSVAVQFEDAWERKDIEFDADLEDAAYTQADPGLLELVWTNLLSNAVKFTPQGGSITLRQTRANGKIYVSVTDTGCGMDEKTIKRIYDKFYQGDTSHSTEGNGLGMALVKRILELTGAEMQIESTPAKARPLRSCWPRENKQNRHCTGRYTAQCRSF